MSDDSKTCETCGAMRDELGDRTFQYILVDAKLRSVTDGDAGQIQSLKDKREKARGEYEEALDHLIRHYQESHPAF